MICIPVCASDIDNAREIMALAEPLCDIVELRIDYLDSIDLPSLLSARHGPVVVTNRKADEGGHFTGTEEERISSLTDAIRLRADFVDVELSTPLELMGEITGAIQKSAAGTRLIVSLHNFTETPSLASLQDLYTRCRAAGGDIVKIVTHARDLSDNLTILTLVDRIISVKGDIIAFCMGDKGKISRVMAPLFGSFLTFASLETGAESAPGQMTVRDMKKIFEVLA